MDPYKLIRAAMSGLVEGFIASESAASVPPPPAPGIAPEHVAAIVDARLASLLDEQPPTNGELDAMFQNAPGWKQSSLLPEDEQAIVDKQSPLRGTYRPDGDGDGSQTPWMAPP
jgi:hypothetical protein